MNDIIQRGADAMRAKRRELIAQPLDRIWPDLMRAALDEVSAADAMTHQFRRDCEDRRNRLRAATAGPKGTFSLNLPDKAGVIPAVKFDHDGKLTLLAAGGGFVLCRRGDCYPMIRTDAEWRALSDTPPVYAAEQGETFHGEHTERDLP